MGVDQRTGEGTNPRIPLVVSKSHRNHGTATTAHRTLGVVFTRSGKTAEFRFSSISICALESEPVDVYTFHLLPKIRSSRRRRPRCRNTVTSKFNL